MSSVPRAVAWSGGVLRLLDQRRLPAETVFLDCIEPEAVFDAIRTLAVRGAPAIGIAAAFGTIVGLEGSRSRAELESTVRNRAERLVGARPTAVNLKWALDRMVRRCDAIGAANGEEFLDLLTREAIAIHDEDEAACQAIAEHGVRYVEQYPNLLTHCNAGALAVSAMGTALAPIYLAHRRGVPVHVYVDETRPLLQGARLTAWELSRAGIDITLIADNMAAHVMAQGRVDAVIVGADRVAANGDVANKIGTLNLAILCRHFGLPFFVACPRSTIDLDTPDGAAIVIEERDPTEVTAPFGRVTAPPDVRAFNPAFDVTPAALVTAIITEAGVIERPEPCAVQSIMVS